MCGVTPYAEAVDLGTDQIDYVAGHFMSQYRRSSRLRYHKLKKNYYGKERLNTAEAVDLGTNK